jgi:hypothetical protein
MDTSHNLQMRMVIVGSVTACLAVAAAPWFNGGRDSVAMLIGEFALLLGLLLVWRQPEVRAFKWGALATAYLFVIAFGTLSLVWSVNRYSTVVWLIAWVMAGFAFRLSYELVGEPRGHRWVQYAYLFVALLLSIYICMAQALGLAKGSFYLVGLAGIYLAPALILGINRLRESIGPKSWVWMAALALTITALFVTATWEVGLALIVLTCAYLLVVTESRRFWITALCSLVLSIGLVAVLSVVNTISIHGPIRISVESVFSANDTGGAASLSSQVAGDGSVISAWLHRPIGGSGAGTVSNVYPQFQKSLGVQSTDFISSSLVVLAELGVVGLVGLIVLVIVLGVGVLRGIVAEPSVIALAFGVVALVVCFGLENGPAYPAALILAAIIFGTVYKQRGTARGRASWIAPTLAAALIVPLVSLYQSNVAATKAAVAESNGDYQTAIALYATAHGGLVYNPDYIDNEGVDLMIVASGGNATANLSAALMQAKIAEHLDPLNGEHFDLEGRVRQQQGDEALAQSAFRAALAVDPYSHPAYGYDLALTQWQAGDQAGALATAQTVLARNPQHALASSSARSYLADLDAVVGNIYMERGELSQAAVSAQDALRFDSDNLRGRALMHALQKLQNTR